MVEKGKEEKKSSRILGRGKTAESSSAPPPVIPATPPSSALGALEDRVSMTVRADEVTFRRENEFEYGESLNRPRACDRRPR